MEDSMIHIKKLVSIFLCSILICLSIPEHTVSAFSSDSISFVVLSHYAKTADIGNEFYILAVTSNGKQPTWKSNNSKVASVNTYGKVIAKKGGTATITAKIKNAEASCKITVNKTKIILNVSNASIERGEPLTITASTSNNSEVVWKSSKKSVATIDEFGTITSLKPGETLITASADGSVSTCHLKVKSPSVSLSKSNIKLYRGQTYKLSATVSSNLSPKWKTNKKSVVYVDDTGYITALKNGTAIITATIDGVSKTCEVTVMKPEITLSSTEITLKKGDQTKIHAYVSSNNTPQWSSSNTNIVAVNTSGEIIALAKGKAYVYVTEDGTKARCTIRVTE
jgi:uncharacterized protein YjdB